MESDAFAALLENPYIWCPGAVLFRRDCLDAVGGFRDVTVADYDIYLRLARRYGARCHHRTVAQWRYHSTNMSNDNVKMLHSLLAVLRENEEFVAGNAARQGALRAGKQGVRRYYGERAVADVRALASSPSGWWRAAKLLPALLRDHPGALPRLVAGSPRRRGRRPL
jgi:hypothetical protein